jgi:hypothetical protein
MARVVMGSWSGAPMRKEDPEAEQAGWEATWPAPRAGSGPYNSFAVQRWLVTDDDNDDEVWAAPDLAVPFVDGIPLFERLGTDWPGVDAAWVLPPSRQWLGSSQYREYGRSIVLDGSCGSAGCCGVIFRITVFPETVLWDQPYCHGAVDIPVELRFEFERTGYEAAVSALANQPIIEWHCPVDDD